jgi:hypothetical protein
VRILLVDVSSVVLDGHRGYLRRTQLTEERQQVAGQLPEVVLHRSSPDRWVRAAVCEPVGSELAEGRLIVPRPSRATGAGRPETEFDLCQQLAARAFDPRLVPSLGGIA